MGLSGLGDLMLTCSSAQSRNFSYGLALGRGEPLRASAAGRRRADAPASPPSLAQDTASTRRSSTPSPASSTDASTIGEAVEALMSRPLEERNRLTYE